MTSAREITDARFSNLSTLVIKVTNRCNLTCLYCYENVSNNGDDMPIELFKTIVDKVLGNSLEKNINFLFHGGEPTLLPNSWYYEALDYINYKASLTQKKVYFNIQTNLVRLKAEKIALFKDYDFNVGVSIDGYQFINSMRGKENAVIENINKLKSQGIKVGILTTINHVNYSYFPEIMTWLEKDVGITSFKANVVYSVGAGRNLKPLKASEIFQAQFNILNYMIRTRGEKVIEQNLVEEIYRFVSDSERITTLCHEKICGAGKKVLGFTLNGEMLPCGRFEWNDKNYVLGTLSSINSNFFEERVKGFHEEGSENWFNCNSCEAKKICAFGCKAFIIRSAEKANIECLPTKLRNDFYLQHYEEISDLAINLQRMRKHNKNSTFQNTSYGYIDDGGSPKPPKPPKPGDDYVDALNVMIPNNTLHYDEYNDSAYNDGPSYSDSVK